MTEAKFIVCPDRDALRVEAAALCALTSADAIATRGRCMISLSGGSTPKMLYALMARSEWSARFDWNRIHLFWGDERCVPISHPDNNYAMVERELLSKVPIPKSNIHRFKTEIGKPEEIAADYEQTIREVFGIASGGIPRFDLILLGLGENGHTASLFPHCPALHETQRLVVADYVDEIKSWRLTMTAPLINAARQVLFLVSGAGKAQVLNDVLNGPHRPEDLPAQLIKPTNGELAWLVDRPAAELVLSAPSTSRSKKYTVIYSDSSES